MGGVITNCTLVPGQNGRGWAKVNEEMVALTPVEFAIMSSLISANGDQVSKLRLVDQTGVSSEYALTMAIARLRYKLQQRLNGTGPIIRRVGGYRLEA